VPSSPLDTCEHEHFLPASLFSMHAANHHMPQLLIDVLSDLPLHRDLPRPDPLLPRPRIPLHRPAKIFLHFSRAGTNREAPPAFLDGDDPSGIP
jgi:hypothetical protein